MFYENLIRDRCGSANDALKAFLEESNFCDDSDPVFAALPDTVTIRNYIPLHQELHQLTHILLSREGRDSPETADGESVGACSTSSYAKPIRGKCWLLNVDDMDRGNNNGLGTDSDDISFDDESIDNAWEDVDGSLWFEDCVKEECGDNVEDTHMDDMSLDEGWEGILANVESDDEALSREEDHL